jgi:hypothetical protein
MTSKTSYVSAAVASVLVLGFAQANAANSVATVAQIRGIALVSQGSDYVNAKPGMALSEGDRVMAMEGGSVDLSFADGCKLNVPDNQVLTVGNASSCSAGTLSQRAVGPYIAAAPAAGAAGAGLGAGAAGAGAAAGIGTLGMGATAGLIAAGTLATVVVVGAASGGGSNSNPVSP